MAARKLALPKGRDLDKTLLIMAFFVVFIDWCNGILWHVSGSSFGLAAIFKALLLAGILFRGGQLVAQQLYAPLILMGLMSIGPLYVVLYYQNSVPVSYLLRDVQLIAKAGALLLAFAYFSVLAKQQPRSFLQGVDRFVLGSYAILLLNTLLGVLGYGGTAYQPMDEVAQKFLGIKGFFISTNELSALLLVLTCWLLTRSWQCAKRFYVLISGGSLVMAMLLLTKTGVFGTLLLIVCVPLLLTPREHFRKYNGFFIAAASVLLLAATTMLFHFTAFLQWVGIYDKLLFAYEQRGIAGILLSSRDYYLQRNFTAVAEHYPAWLPLFGVGQGGVNALLKKYFIELDLFDLLLFYGLAGLLLFSLSFWRVLFSAVSQLRLAKAAAPVLLLNMLLLAVSMLAGHIVTSGMLWLPWALVNAALVAQTTLSEQTRSIIAPAHGSEP